MLSRPSLVLTTCLISALGLGRTLHAADKSMVQEKWHTPFDLYLNPVEANEMKNGDPAGVSFVDIRNRAEIQYVGFSNTVDANIPLFFFDPTQWKEKAGRNDGRYRQVYNDQFVAAVDRLVAGRKLDKTAPVILMCTSGSRAPIAALQLHEAGYTRVYTQHEGFEGIKAKSGPFKGKRQINGWKNGGLPWRYRMRTDRMYFNFAPTVE